MRPDNDLSTSRLLALTRSARRLPHPVIAVSLAVLFEVAPLALLLAVDSGVSLPEALVPAASAQTVILGVVYSLYVVQLGTWVVLWERRSIVTLGLERAKAGRKLLRGAALGVAVYLGLLAFLAGVGMVEVRSDRAAGQGWAVAGAAAIALGGWAVQGTAEELVYRGWLLPVVAARTRLLWGIAASTVIFALTHLLGNPFNGMMMINLVLFGVFFALWALREGALWGLIGWHVAVNWVSENLIVVGEGAGVGPLADGLLLGLNETGHNLATGGAVGLEASVLTSLVLVVSIVAVARWPRRNGRG